MRWYSYIIIMVISEKSCSTESIFVIIGTDSLWILVTLKVGLQNLGYMLFKKKKILTQYKV